MNRTFEDYDAVGDELVLSALMKVTKNLRKVKKPTKRGRRLSRASLDRLYKPRSRDTSIKAAAFEVMERAYMRASANNTLPANARQIMYQARSLMQALTEKPLQANYFTQTLLPDFMKAFPGRTSGWDVVYDARGHLEEPHTEKRIGLGTIDVRRYVNSWHSEIPPLTLSNISLEINTIGPENRYKFALFIEKEGFDALLNRSQIGKRYDIAIMSTKGMSVTACRKLVESLTARGVPTLVAHDFDVAGFNIYHTLHTSTKRYTFRGRPNVDFLGLRLSDVEEMGLDSERVDPGDATEAKLRKAGATAEEIEFLMSGERVELNAMDSQQFIDWLERKFKEHGVVKVVPNDEILGAAYKRAALVRHANAALAAIQENWKGDIEVPADLVAQVGQRITGTPLSWDEAIKEIQAPKIS